MSAPYCTHVMGGGGHCYKRTNHESRRCAQHREGRDSLGRHRGDDVSSEAAQKAFPDTEWTHPGTTAAFREAYDKGAAEGWEACKKALWDEIRGLGSWRDPETGHHEFDLQPLGPDTTSEKSARELIVKIFEDVQNPYGEGS